MCKVENKSLVNIPDTVVGWFVVLVVAVVTELEHQLLHKSLSQQRWHDVLLLIVIQSLFPTMGTELQICNVFYTCSSWYY